MPAPYDSIENPAIFPNFQHHMIPPTSDLVSAFVGGLVIALATTINLSLAGRVTGISGILSSVYKFDAGSGLEWKMSFIAGLLVPASLASLIFGDGVNLGAFQLQWFDSEAWMNNRLHETMWVLSGALVGFGTRMGCGCTSGHGVCGLPRFSLRSLVAVGCFMASGMVVSSSLHYLGFFNAMTGHSWGATTEQWWQWAGPLVTLWLVVQAAIVASLTSGWIDYAIGGLTGFLFGCGLLLSGMCRVSKVSGFLTLDWAVWDPSLALVMGGAVGFNLCTFPTILQREKPVVQESFSCPSRTDIDWELVLGSCIFGVGWGLGGMCPGPGLMSTVVKTHSIIWAAGLIGGMALYDFVCKPAIEDAKVSKISETELLVNHCH